MKARFIVPFVAVGALFASASAMAATGFTINTFHMFSGPGREYSQIETVPENARVNVNGCLSRRDWCEVTWNGVRGWMDSNGIEVWDRGQRVRASDLDLPIVTFRANVYDRDRIDEPRVFYRGRWMRDSDRDGTPDRFDDYPNNPYRD